MSFDLTKLFSKNTAIKLHKEEFVAICKYLDECGIVRVGSTKNSSVKWSDSINWYASTLDYSGNDYKTGHMRHKSFIIIDFRTGLRIGTRNCHSQQQWRDFEENNSYASKGYDILSYSDICLETVS